MIICQDISHVDCIDNSLDSNPWAFSLRASLALPSSRNGHFRCLASLPTLSMFQLHLLVDDASTGEELLEAGSLMESIFSE